MVRSHRDGGMRCFSQIGPERRRIVLNAFSESQRTWETFMVPIDPGIHCSSVFRLLYFQTNRLMW